MASLAGQLPFAQGAAARAASAAPALAGNASPSARRPFVVVAATELSADAKVFVPVVAALMELSAEGGGFRCQQLRPQ